MIQRTKFYLQCSRNSASKFASWTVGGSVAQLCYYSSKQALWDHIGNASEPWGES